MDRARIAVAATTRALGATLCPRTACGSTLPSTVDSTALTCLLCNLGVPFEAARCSKDEKGVTKLPSREPLCTDEHTSFPSRFAGTIPCGSCLIVEPIDVKHQSVLSSGGNVSLHSGCRVRFACASRDG